jgi:integrase
VIEWANEYLEEAQNRFVDKTFKEKKSAFKRFIQSAQIEAECPVEFVSLDVCRKFLNHQFKRRSGYAANKDRKNLGTAWNWGTENLHDFPAGKNPFHTIKKFPEKRSRRYVPPERDFWKAYHVAEGQDKVMLLAFYYLGARRGEIFQLKLADLDFNNDQVCLWTKKREGGDMEPDWLPMTPDLRNALLSWREIRLSQSYVDTEHVFICLERTAFCEEYYGKPFKVRQHFMKKLCEKANVKQFGFHSIRHLVATILYHKGSSLSEIQAFLRHKSPATTEKYLRSLGLKHVRKALEKGLSSPREAFMEKLSRLAKIIPFPKGQASRKIKSKG